MLTSALEIMVTWTILGLEFAALLAVILGFGWSVYRLSLSSARSTRHDGYESLRRDLGRSTLIALELLVAADILRSLVLELSLPNVSVLAALVAIRTFLSFSINVELYGCWPWDRQKFKSATESPEHHGAVG
ncbi:MAG: DUF1622 domain-containing protein [Alphaproteobacteria bacterium]|nr:DUF1622 domain-containing protein [Alphaproteobacteria bacterium]